MSLLSSLIKSQKIVSLSPKATVLEASLKMKDAKVGSMLVLEGEKLVGIFTERDLLNKVIAARLDASKTPLSQVMSKNVRTISAGETIQNCFKRMQENKCRRLPILDGSKVVGMVTMRNILEWLVDEMEDENIHLKKYIQS